MSTLVRTKLGDFCSIVCLKSLIVGMEDAWGKKATAISLITSGRLRGKSLTKYYGLSDVSKDFRKIAIVLNEVIGENGTRLMAIEKIVQVDGKIKVYCFDTVCSAGEMMGSNRQSTFSMGVIWGALEEFTGLSLRGTQTESLLDGSTYDIFEFRVFCKDHPVL
jgi:hypothetical protein